MNLTLRKKALKEGFTQVCSLRKNGGKSVDPLLDYALKNNLLVTIDRSSLFGNPFILGKDGDRETVIEKYRQYLKENRHLVRKARAELQGKVLGCWCYPLPCHGDILAKICNYRKED